MHKSPIIEAHTTFTRHQADEVKEFTLTKLVDKVLLTNLGDEAIYLMVRLQTEAAIAADISHLCKPSYPSPISYAMAMFAKSIPNGRACKTQSIKSNQIAVSSDSNFSNLDIARADAILPAIAQLLGLPNLFPN